MPQDTKDVPKPTDEGGSPSDPKSPEAAPSNDVKPNQPGESKAIDQTPVEAPKETPAETPKDDKTAKEKQEQIDNLNTALKEEREFRKMDAEESKKQIGEIQTSLEKSQDTIQKLEGVFSPEEETPAEETPLTESQVQEMIKKGNEERTKEEDLKSKQGLIKKEIKEMEKEWDGKDGKPKYDDDEIVRWQKDNDFLYLTPKQAFNERYHNEIVDFEAKKRMTEPKKVQDVETPSPIEGGHTPSEGEAPKSDLDLRQMVTEAMDTADEEM
jgi:hypothetical protein